MTIISDTVYSVLACGRACALRASTFCVHGLRRNTLCMHTLQHTHVSGIVYVVKYAQTRSVAIKYRRLCVFFSMGVGAQCDEAQRAGICLFVCVCSYHTYPYLFVCTANIHTQK